MEKIMPLVSVVTVSYNAVDCIERTMQSVFGQTYANIEYIVNDGGSNDGTVGIIQKYASRIDYWISEKDRGIYDAMNKGIRQARGEWISFINCGDEYCGSTVLEEVFHSAIENRTGVIYGNIMFKYAWGNVEKKPDDLSGFNRYFPIFHPSTLVRTSLMKEYLFDTSFRIAADYHFFYRLYLKKECEFLYIPVCMSIFDAESGISSTQQNLFFIENARVTGSYKSFYFHLSFARFRLRNGVAKCMKKILPKAVVTQIRMKKMMKN